jgi:hypothetical protein
MPHWSIFELGVASLFLLYDKMRRKVILTRLEKLSRLAELAKSSNSLKDN